MNSILSFSLIDLLTVTENLPGESWLVIPLFMIKYIPVVVLVPRFTSRHGRYTVGSAIVFAEGRQSEEVEHNGGIPMEEMGICEAGDSA